MTEKDINLKFAIEQKIISIQKEIIEAVNPIRGIYGIFVKYEEDICVYIGRTYSIFDRMFDYDGHIAKLRAKNHSNSQLMDALKSGKEIEIRILEEVPFHFDNYYKDMQRLASAENKYIDLYQEKDQCLEQVPEGKWISKEAWENKKLANSN